MVMAVARSGVLDAEACHKSGVGGEDKKRQRIKGKQDQDETSCRRRTRRWIRGGKTRMRVG